MAFEKGQSGNPSGRPKGSENRTTSAMKKAMAVLIDEKLDNMSDWLDKMAKDDPKAAFQCMLSLMEFHIPKMSRVTWEEDKKENGTNCSKEIEELVQKNLEDIRKLKLQEDEI